MPYTIRKRFFSVKKKRWENKFPPFFIYVPINFTL